MLAVSHQSEWQLVFLFEFLMRLDRVGAYTNDGCIESLEPREGVAKLARLDGSPARVVLWIEVEENTLTLQRREREGRAGIR